METGIIPFNYGPYGNSLLLFGLLVYRMCFAPAAILLEFDFAVYTLFVLLVLAGPIVNALAFLALQLDESDL